MLLSYVIVSDLLHNDCTLELVVVEALVSVRSAVEALELQKDLVGKCKAAAFRKIEVFRCGVSFRYFDLRW